MPMRSSPPKTRTRPITPSYTSYQLSKMSARTVSSFVGFGRRDALDDRFEHVVDPDALLRAGENRVVGVEPDDLLDLMLGALDVRAGQIDLVDHRDNFEAVVERQIDVGERLRLDTLARIDDQQRALARGQAARNFVGEVDVPWGIDQD